MGLLGEADGPPKGSGLRSSKGSNRAHTLKQIWPSPELETVEEGPDGFSSFLGESCHHNRQIYGHTNEAYLL